MKNLSFVLAFLVSGILFAQKTFEGEITFKIEYEDLSEQMAPYKSMLPKGSVVFVKETISKVVTPNGMGGETVVISNSETGDILTLMNQMGNKIAMKTNSKEAIDEADFKVDYIDESKEILGYKCKKAVVTSPDGNEVEMFYTEELENIKLNANTAKVKGFPMQIIMSQEMFTMVQTVDKIDKKKVKKIKMDIPSDYVLKTMEELKKMSGGM